MDAVKVGVRTCEWKPYPHFFFGGGEGFVVGSMYNIRVSNDLGSCWVT